MDPKVARRGTENRGESKPFPQATSFSATNQQQASRDTSFLTLDRPWANRHDAMSNILKDDLWRKVETQDGSAMERWKIQSMVDSPYHGLGSCVTRTKDSQPKLPGIQSPGYAKPVSQAAGTTGTKKT
ncbi:hypothetical protein F5Y11DRAFT_13615 [Daldinia sp. FL1419]|nr:hypothetical protein F5Y11DRAFT_13615 [Daldinia sp. FL1419]